MRPGRLNGSTLEKDSQVADAVEDGPEQVAALAPIAELLHRAGDKPGASRRLSMALADARNIDHIVEAAACALADAGSREGNGEMILPVPVRSTSTMLRSASRKPPPARSWIRGSLTGEATKSKSASSLTAGSFAEARWLLMESTVLTAISTLSTASMIRGTGWRKSLAIISRLFTVGECSGQVAVAIRGRL